MEKGQRKQPSGCEFMRPNRYPINFFMGWKMDILYIYIYSFPKYLGVDIWASFVEFFLMGMCLYGM